MDDEPPSPKSEFLMAVAGPIASFILAGIFFLLARLGEAGHWYLPIVGVLAYLSFLNTIVATFNLVPAFPLDGGRMLRAGLWSWKRKLIDATRIASRIGTGFGWVLMILGVVTFIQGNFVAGTWWFLIGLFLRGAALASYRQVVIRDTLQGEPIRRIMTSHPVTVPPSLTIQQLVYDYIYEYHFKMFPVVEDGRFLGCVTSRDVRELPRSQWEERHVGDIIQPISSENSVSPDSDTTKLLSRMTQPDVPGRMMVVENQQLVGVISFKDLKAFISLKLDLEPTAR
jgi:CBS domain-containing protein